MSTFLSNHNTLARLKVGIVGGMGVEATHTFSGYINSATKSLGYIGEEHIPSKAIDDSLKPDRTPFILKTEGAESPAPAIIQGCKYVKASGASVVFIPCNTAHATSIFDEVKENSPLPIISLIDLTLDYIQRNYNYAEHVGLLATNGTVDSQQVYHPSFNNAGISIITPDPSVQDKVMDAIYNEKTGIKAGRNRNTPFNSVKSGSHPSIIFRDAVLNICNHPDFTAETNTKLIIAGCTEVPIALSQSDVPDIILIDPMKIAAIAAVKFAHDTLLQTYLSSSEEKSKEILDSHYKRILLNSPITKYEMQGLEEQLSTEHGNLEPIPPVTISKKVIAAHTKTHIVRNPSPTHESSDGESVDSEAPSVPTKENIQNILATNEYKITSGTSFGEKQTKNVLRIKFTNSDVTATGIASAIITAKNGIKDLNLYLREHLINTEYGLEHYKDIRFHKNENSLTISDTPQVREFLSSNLGITADKIQTEQKTLRK